MEKYVNLRNVIRVLSVLLIIFYFIPSFMVSCGGVNVHISAASSTFGIRAQGEQVADPSPAMILVLLIPIVILLFYTIQKKLPASFTDKLLAIIGLSGTGIDLLMQIIFVAGVHKQVGGYEFRVLGGYIFTILFICILAAAFLRS